MKKTVTFLMMMILFATLSAQTVTLTFTAQDAYGQYVQIDRVVVINQTKGWQEIVQWPDTTFLMQNSLGVDDYSGKRVFALSQNNPNPFGATTDVELAVIEEGNVSIEVADIHGRIVSAKQCPSMQPGIHHFRVSLANAGMFVLTARQNKKSSTIKMVCKDGGASNVIDYVEAVPSIAPVLKAGSSNPFEYGDMMQYVAYTHEGNTEVASLPLTQVQLEPQNIVLSFAGAVAGDSLPCLGAATVTDHEGNVYNTVRIGAQCWTRENMRCTTSPNGYLAFGGTDTSDYCNESDHSPYYYDFTQSVIPLNERGLLYNWAGAMDTISAGNDVLESFSGRRGICPAGWHVPSMAEWDSMSNYLNAQSEYVCNFSGNIAKAIASQSYWDSTTSECTPGNDPSLNNATGFTAIPAGIYFWYGFRWSGTHACFWASTSTIINSVLPDNLYVYWQHPDLGRPEPAKGHGLSVRCLRD